MPENELEQLVAKIEKYTYKTDTKLVRRAFELASKLHEKQKRKSGEAFIFHPLGVANILADLQMDTTTIVASLLHDVVEDTAYPLDKITEEFGEEVSQLIDGVTKLSRLKFKSHADAQAENLRKMLVAMAKDIRVIIIKLADRLHNMRTLCYLSHEKQEEKALETRDIYAPLAHRLGLSHMKWELEDLSFSTLEPKKFRLMQRMTAESREERDAFLNGIMKTIEEELKKAGIKARLSGRTKHLWSIYQKMVKRGKDFGEIYDLSAVRIVVDSVRDCYAVLGAIHSIWTPVPGRFKDYIAMPKFNFYQSLHTTVIGPKGQPFEIQIRTPEMHSVAEYGIAAHWGYKEGQQSPTQLDDRFTWLRQMMEWQKETKDPGEFMESLRTDLFEDEVFVFTPKGDVYSLRSGATPLDFAYAVHTEVGHHCIGAKVNGQIVALGYTLQLGDIVEIMTNKSSPGPSKDWLNIVKTPRARSKIRQWFSTQSRVDSEQMGREAVAKLLRKQGFGPAAAMTTEVIATVCKQMNFSKPETFFAAIGAGKVAVKQAVIKILAALNKDATYEEAVEPFELPVTREKAYGKTGIKVKGIGDVLVRLAHCCHPVPGDDVVGFVTQGRGVSVHRADCLNFVKLREQKERIVEVSWDENAAAVHHVELRVEALDRANLLRDISTVLSDSGVNILSASVTTRKDRIAVFRFVYETGNMSGLKDIIATIKRIDVVYDAYRVMPRAGAPAVS